MTMQFDRFIRTKHDVIPIPDGVEGTPVEDYFKGVALPESLKGAVVYELPEGTIIAYPEADHD